MGAGSRIGRLEYCNPLFEKRDKRDWINYRGISLIGAAVQISMKGLKSRTRHFHIDVRPGCGYIDQIFNLRRVLEGPWYNQQPIAVFYRARTDMWFSWSRVTVADNEECRCTR